MLLRYLVNNWIRETARGHLFEAVSQMSPRAPQPAGDEPEVEQPPCRILLAFALSIEAGGTVDLLQNAVMSQCASFVEHAGTLDGQRVAVLETGIGCQAASRAITDAIALHHPAWVVSAGFAGALIPRLGRGHILMADRLQNATGSELDLGLKLDAATLAADDRLHTGKLLTVDHLVRTRAEKESLAAEHGAVACDMESFAVAEECRGAKVRFLSVRIISDALEDELPKEIERLVDQDTLAAKLGAATGALFKRPSSVKDMWKLKEDAIRASDRLARFLRSTIAQLE